MLDYETRYVMIELYCLALVWATRRLRHYMTEYSVHLISYLDPLRYLFDKVTLVGRLMRWWVLKSIRGRIVVDHLISLPVFDDRVIDDDFPYEDVAVMTSLSSWHISIRLAFSDRHPATNNIVEYEACILGLEIALELGIRQMEVMGYRHYWEDFAKSSSGHEFILVAIDYFTKSSTYRPQTNGAVETTNKNIKRILRMIIKTSRDWSKKLSFALWAYQTSFHTSMGATPYSLVYGMETVLLVEIEMGLLRVALEQQIWSFPSFILPYHPSLYYVPCLNTTLRSWDQMLVVVAHYIGAYFRPYHFLTDRPSKPPSPSTRRLEPSSLLSYDVQSRLSQFDIKRCKFSVMAHHIFLVCAFIATISLQVDVQSHHRFSVTMFRVVFLSLTFRDSYLQLGVQSHYPSSVMAFRGFIFFSMAFRAASLTWRSKPPSLLSLGVQSHISFQFGVQTIILSRSGIRCHLFGIQGYIPSVQAIVHSLALSHHIFSLAFRAISQPGIRCHHFPLV
ncbi:hypothetical protein AAG906_020436 [Vitis piasezkii]